MLTGSESYSPGLTLLPKTTQEKISSVHRDLGGGPWLLRDFLQES